MKPSIVGLTDSGVVFGPDAATLAQWTLTVHDGACRECGADDSDSRCGQGQRYADAANNSNDDLPGYRT